MPFYILFLLLVFLKVSVNQIENIDPGASDRRVITSVVVSPGGMTFPLKPSLIIAQAVLCNFLHQSNCSGTLLATNSTATIGKLTNLEVHSPPRWAERAESSPTWRPLLKEMSGEVLTAIFERFWVLRMLKSS